MEATVPCSVKSGSDGIPSGNSSDAHSILEANKHMQAELRRRKGDLELGALYRRRNAVLSLIRSLEHYRQTSTRYVQVCPRRVPSAAV